MAATGFFVASNATAQPLTSKNSDKIFLGLQKLKVLGSVLYIAAHPDDENTRLLTYFSKDKQYRTGYLSLTRGDGGQNLIGDEQGIELGLIRTQELLAARRIDGAQQFFTRAYDFGYSKTSKETLEIWGHDKILSDMVWIIRKFQPEVIITRFPPDERAGHGHHQTSAILAGEAFIAAADIHKYPEQFKYGVKPWQAKRLLWNTYNFGNNNTIRPNQFKIDVGGYSPLLGESYGEIASLSRSQHKSQGFGVGSQRGTALEFFEQVAGDKVESSLMEGINISWSKINGGKAIDPLIDSILNQYNFQHPENSVSLLTDLYQSIKNLPEESLWKEEKLEEVTELIFNCLGIFADATTTTEYAVQQDSLTINCAINQRLHGNAILKSISIGSNKISVNKVMKENENTNITAKILVDKAISQPYWLQNPMQKGSYTVNEQQLIGKPQNDPPYVATFEIEVNGKLLSLKRPVQYKYTDPVKGEVYEPLVIVPELTVSLDPALLLTGVQNSVTALNNPEISIKFEAQIDQSDAEIKVQLEDQEGKIIQKDTILNLSKGKTYVFSLPLPSSNKTGTETYTAAVLWKIGNKANSFNKALKKISYGHIPVINYFYVDSTKVINEPIITKGKNIGYITGAGDKIPQALNEMGYTVKLLTEKDITYDNLKKFDAVIAGVRAYNVHDWLQLKYDVLMRYIKNGGNYIVQYNTSGYGSAASFKMGPYDFTIARTRVTDENAEVKILTPENPVLNYPNKIGKKDFENWIQERSIYQAETWDSHYQTPFAMHDNGESESKGSLIIAPFGKGNFVYTGLVFFRELPAGVAGAFPLIANLIALPKNK